jgi:rod shape-determining protein MreC
MSNTPNRISWLALAIMVGVAFALYFLDSTGNLDSALSFLRDPAAAVSGAANSPAQTVSSALDAPRNLNEANNRLAELEQRVAELERENETLRDQQQEYALLAEMAAYAEESAQITRVMAEVIGRSPNPLFQNMIIDKGTADGVQIGMAVDSTRGLVGQVYRVNEHSALVLLVTDTQSSIPGRLSSNRTTGLVHGGGLGRPLKMDWIPLEAEVTVGDIVVTSGLVGQFAEGAMVSRFPAGLVIGRVAGVQRSEAEILQTAEVLSAVDFASLERVWVVTGFPLEDFGGFANPLGDN